MCAALYYTGKVSLNFYIFCMTGNSLIIIGFYFFLESYKSLKFSGHPFINNESRQKNKLIRSVAQYLMLGEFLDLSIFIFLIVSILILEDSIDNILTNQSWSSICFYAIYLFELFFTEFLVVFFATNKQYLKSFEFNFSITERLTDETMEVSGSAFNENNTLLTKTQQPVLGNQNQMLTGGGFRNMRKASFDELEEMISHVSTINNTFRGSLTDSTQITSFNKTPPSKIGISELELTRDRTKKLRKRKMS